MSDGYTCLQEKSYNDADYERIRRLPAAGEIYSLDDQCVLALGIGSRVCSSLIVSIIIDIYHELEGGIEKSVMRITIRHQDAYC